MWNILLSSLISGLSSPLGAWLALRFKHINKELLAFFLGLAGGIMLTVILTEMLPASLAAGNHRLFWIGVVSGWVGMWGMGKLVQHITDTRITPSESGTFLRIGLFIAVAMAIHDLPEGLAIGAANAIQPNIGLLIAFAIALHNIPEGMSIAFPLYLGGLTKRRILWITVLIGTITPIGTLIALALVQISPAFIALSLAFASGSMAYVVAHELLPEALHTHKWFAGYGFAGGSALMTFASFIHF